MADTPVNERRAHPRFESQTRVEVSILDRHELQTLWATNISKGGLFVATESPPPLGSKVHVDLRMFGGALVLHARVVHRVTPEMARGTALDPGAGLEFTDLNRSTRAQIEAYIAGRGIDAHEERHLLRQSWCSVFPDRVTKAEQRVVEAIELHNRDQVDRARALLAEAIELDPFNQELAALAAAWKEHP